MMKQCSEDAQGSETCPVTSLYRPDQSTVHLIMLVLVLFAQAIEATLVEDGVLNNHGEHGPERC